MNAEATGPDHSGAPARVTGPYGGVLQIRDAVDDPVRGGPFPGGGQPISAERARDLPGAGGVDDRTGRQTLLAALGRYEMDGEGLLLPVGVDDAVPSAARDPDDARAVADPFAQGVRQRLEIQLGPLTAGGVGGVVGTDPAGGGEELLGGRVDDLGPGREQPHMAPLPHGGAGARARLQDQRVLLAGDEVGRGGQADRTGSDDHGG